MTSPIETNNVVERLRTYSEALTKSCSERGKGEALDLRVGPHMCIDAMTEAADLIQSLSDRIDVLEGESRQLKIDRLTILAMVYHIAPATVAKMCDEQLDRSGALLGEVREIDRRASLTQGGKNAG